MTEWLRSKFSCECALDLVIFIFQLKNAINKLAQIKIGRWATVIQTKCTHIYAYSQINLCWIRILASRVNKIEIKLKRPVFPQTKHFDRQSSEPLLVPCSFQWLRKWPCLKPNHKTYEWTSVDSIPFDSIRYALAINSHLLSHSVQKFNCYLLYPLDM